MFMAFSCTKPIANRARTAPIHRETGANSRRAIMAVRTPVLRRNCDGAVCYFNALMALRIPAHAQIRRFPWERTVSGARRLQGVTRRAYAQALDIALCVRVVTWQRRRLVAPFPRGSWPSLAALAQGSATGRSRGGPYSLLCGV